MIDGVAYKVGAEAVVVRSREPLTVLSISDLGALAARAAHRCLARGVRAWLERHR